MFTFLIFYTLMKCLLSLIYSIFDVRTKPYSIERLDIVWILWKYFIFLIAVCLFIPNHVEGQIVIFEQSSLQEYPIIIDGENCSF